MAQQIFLLQTEQSLLSCVLCGACGITGFPSRSSATHWGDSPALQVLCAAFPLQCTLQPVHTSLDSSGSSNSAPCVVPLHDLLGFRINPVATATLYSIANSNFSMWTLAFCISCNSVHNQVKSCKSLVQAKGHRELKSGTVPGSWRFKKLSLEAAAELIVYTEKSY